MSDMQDAFDKLSQRGTPRGFDHVLAGAAASAARGTDDGDSGADAGDLEPIPFVTSEAQGRGAATVPFDDHRGRCRRARARRARWR